MHDEPIDPFAGDPADPSNELADLDDLEPSEDDTLTTAEREDVLEDLADLEVYQTLLTPVGVRGLVIECEDCHEPHYFDWDLLRGNLRHLLDSGRPRVHEPAYDPDPDHYVTWEYARGYADGTHDALAGNGEGADGGDPESGDPAGRGLAGGGGPGGERAGRGPIGRGPAGRTSTGGPGGRNQTSGADQAGDDDGRNPDSGAER